MHEYENLLATPKTFFEALTNFMILVSLYTPLKTSDISCILIFSGGIERIQLYEMG